MLISDAIQRLSGIQQRHGNLRLVDDENREVEFKYSPAEDSNDGEAAVLVEAE